MQLTTLFSFATSLALASAGAIKSRQFEGVVAVVDVFDYNTTNCAGDEPTVKIGVGPKAQDQCIPFSQGYTTVSYSYLEPGYSIVFYTTQDCTDGSDIAQSSEPGLLCSTSPSGNPWLSYQVSSPKN